MNMDIRYKELLIKYSGNDEVMELLKLVRNDYIRERESYYLVHKQYPMDRDLIGKLMVDLDTTKKFLVEKNKV